MVEAVQRTISRHNMLPRGSRVIAAVSGGPDSVCLLHLLLDIAPELEITVAGIAHVNHKLRGEESEGDQQFVASLAASKGLSFHLRNGPVWQEKASQDNLEQSLRRIRRDFFASLIHEGAATHVALGHTLDDQAETVLFRLMRGSGLAGLAGILPVTHNGFVRPILEVSRADVRAYLTAQGIPWREDSSNRDPKYARNRIRHSLLPQLASEWNPRISETLAHLADLAYQEELWWAAEIAREAPRMFMESAEGLEARGEELAALPEAYLRRVLRHAVRKLKGDLRGVEFQHIEELVELVRATTQARVEIPGVRAERSLGWVRFVTKSVDKPPEEGTSIAVAIPGKYPAPDGNSLIFLELIQQPPGGVTCDTLKLDLVSAKIPGPLKLRGWRQGDRYRPLGQHRERKLKEMFQESKVPSWRRLGWPILCVGERIVWARRFGVAAEFAAAAGFAASSFAASSDDARRAVSIRETPLPDGQSDGK